MKDEQKTKEQRINELVELRQRVAELEASETERKRAEEALRQYREHLEDLVEERTSELQQEITERKRAEEEIRQRTAQLESLRQVGLEITAQLNLDDLLHSIVSQAVELLEGHSVAIDLYRPDLDLLEWVVSVGLDQPPPASLLRRGEGLCGKVWESGQPLILNDYHQWEGRADGWEDYPFTAVMGVPIRWGEEFLGVLEISALPPRTFSPADAELLGLFATQAAIAIQNARLYEEAQGRAERLAVVNRIASAVGAVLDLDELMETVYQEVDSIFQADAFFIALYDEGANELDFRLLVDEGVREPPQRRPLETGLTSLVVAEKKPLLVRDMEQEQDRLPLPEVWGTMKLPASWLGVPMLIGKQLIGVICVQDYRPYVYGEDEELLLSTIADQVAVAVEQARLYEDARRRALEQETVSRIAYALNTPDAREAFPVLVEGLQNLTGCDLVNLIAMDETGEQFIMSVLESPFPIPGEGDVKPLSVTAAAEDIEAGRSHLTADLSTEIHFPFEQALYQAGLRSSVTLPLLVGGEVFGALNLGDSHTGLFQEDQLPVLRQIADAVALALQNSFIFQAEREQRELAESLEKAAAALTATLDPDRVLDRILEEVSYVVPHDAANIMLIKGHQVRAVRWRGYERFDADDLFSSLVLDLSELHGLRQMADSREPMAIPDVTTYPGWVQVHEWQHSYAAAPIVVHDEVIGFLNVDSATRGFFTQDHTEALRAFADHAAAALENARLFEAERERSTQLGAVAKVAERIASILNPDELLRETVELITQTFGYYYAAIMLLDAEANELVFNVGAGGYAGRTPAGFRQKVKEGMVGWAAHLGETIWANDVSQEPRYIPAYLPETRSELDVPLKYHDRVIGVLDLQSRELNAFTRHDVMAMETLAGHVAAALENARLYEAERRRRAEFEALRQASLHLTSTLELQPILEAILDHALKLVAAYDAHVFLYDGQRLAFGAALWEDGRQQKPFAEPRPQGLTYTVARSGERIVIPDVDSHSLFRDYQWGGAIVGLPLRIGERVVGVMTVAFQRLHTFDESELRVLELLADQAAVAIENARLYEAAQREIAERKRTGEALQESEENYRALVEQSLQGLVVIQDFHIVFANTAFAEVSGYTVEELLALSPEEVRSLVHPEDQALVWERLRARLAGEAVPPRYEYRGVRKDGTKRWLEVFASRVEYDGRPAIQGALIDITESKQAEEALERRAAQMATLNRIGRQVAAILDQQELLQQAVDAVREDLGYLQAAVLLMDEETSELYVAAATDNFWEVIPDDYRQPLGKGAIGTAAQTGKAVLVKEASSDDRVYRVGEWFSPSSLSVPIKIGGQVIGVLGVEADAPNAFDEDDAMVMDTLADQVAVAIENARLFEQAQQDITERKRAQEELRQRQLQLSVLNRMGRALAGTFELVRIYRIAYEHVAQLVDCPSFGISLYDAPTLTLRAEFMLDEGKLIDAARFPPLVMDMEPTQGRVRAIATRQPEIITDYPAVLEKAKDGGGIRVGFSKNEHITGAAMYVPMVARDQVIGLLEVQSYQLDAYDLEEAALLGPVANQIGLSIQNAQLYEEAQRELAERKRAQEELRHTLKKLREALGGIIQTVASAVETKDPYTAGHQRRVANLARAIANEMGLSEDRIDGIRMAGLIHDLGKIAIPAEILSTPVQLNDFQWGMIKTHPQGGYDILKTVEFPWPVAEIVLQHHERMDGSGYPAGLSGDEIMLEARILAVADVVEAMASHRPYRPLLGLDKALEEISQNRGVLYDPEVVDACLKLFSEKGFEFD